MARPKAFIQSWMDRLCLLLKPKAMRVLYNLHLRSLPCVTKCGFCTSLVDTGVWGNAYYLHCLSPGCCSCCQNLFCCAHFLFNKPQVFVLIAFTIIISYFRSPNSLFRFISKLHFYGASHFIYLRLQ